MAKNGKTRNDQSDKSDPLIIDAATGRPEPTPRGNPQGPGAFGKDGRRIDLSTLKDVRIELARVYRMMDAGELESQDGTRRAYVLKMAGELIEAAELEKRIADLEQRQAQFPGSAAALPYHPTH